MAQKVHIRYVDQGSGSLSYRTKPQTLDPFPPKILGVKRFLTFFFILCTTTFKAVFLEIGEFSKSQFLTNDRTS